MPLWEVLMKKKPISSTAWLRRVFGINLCYPASTVAGSFFSAFHERGIYPAASGWPVLCCLPRIPLSFGPGANSGGVHPSRTLRRQCHHQAGWLHLPGEARLPLMHPGSLNVIFSRDITRKCLFWTLQTLSFFSLRQRSAAFTNLQ